MGGLLVFQGGLHRGTLNRVQGNWVRRHVGIMQKTETNMHLSANLEQCDRIIRYFALFYKVKNQQIMTRELKLNYETPVVDLIEVNYNQSILLDSYGEGDKEGWFSGTIDRN